MSFISVTINSALPPNTPPITAQIIKLSNESSSYPLFLPLFINIDAATIIPIAIINP